MPRRVDDGDDGAPRCAACGYFLVGLARGECPECGRPFNLDVRETYETRPPYRFFAYWLPAFVATSAVWLVYAFVLLTNDSIGYSLSLAVPSTAGFLAAYGGRPGRLAMVWMGLTSLLAVVLTLISAHLVGIFCGVILGLIGLIPYSIGAAFGATLNSVMKERRWYSQRHWLPLLVALATPAVVELAERRWSSPPAIVAQATPILLHASFAEAWHAQVGDAPGIPRSPLHAIHLTRPLEQSGPRGVGAESRIRFSKGTLDVRVTERDEAVGRYAFAYVGQSHVEDRAIRLIDTAFAYEPIAASETRLTITTRYEPLMTPRWAWGPFEHWAGTATHELIGRQMQRSIDARR